MRTLRRLIIALLLLPVFLWIGANAFLWLQADRLSQMLSKELGADLSFERASLHLLPGPGVSLKDLSVKGSSSVNVTSISATLAYAPLLSGKVRPSSVNVSGLTMKEPKVDLGQLNLELHSVDTSNENAPKGKASLEINDLTIVDGIDNYHASKINGEIDLKLQKDNPSFSGDLNVKGFGYSDGETIITKVNAKLNDIKGSIPTGGDVVVNVNLDADSIDLTNPSIHITDVDKVSAPVVVKVPAAGGYEVSGPVKIENAVLETGNREFNRVSSEIDMLVSSPLKDFVAESIAFALGALTGDVKTRFSMTPTQYIIGDTTLNLKEGVFTAGLTLQRGREKNINGNMQAHNVNVTDILTALSPDDAGSFGGIVRSFSTTFSGQSGKLKDSLSAQGDFAIDEIEKDGKKLSEEILKVAEETPFLAPSDSSDNDEPDHLLSGAFNIEDRVISLKKVQAPFKHFKVEANGGVTLDKEVDVTVEVVFLEETFGSLGVGIKPLKELFGNIGKYTIPIAIEGTLPDVTVESDSAEWLKRFVGISMLEDIGTGVAEATKAVAKNSSTG